MPKKTSTAKKKTSAKATTPAKRGPGRPPGSKNKNSGPATKKTAAKKSTSKKSVKEVSKPKGKRGGANREVNEETGFVVGTDQDTIALALLEGGESRVEITERLRKKLGKTTRNGTEKMVGNMVAGVLGKLLDRGFTVESHFQVNPPTPASKRAAARKRKK